MLNKSELIKAVSEATGHSQKTSHHVMDTLFKIIKKEVKDTGKQEINGFGIFEKKVTSARKGRNPATGETIDIGEKTGVKFRPSSPFKDYMMDLVELEIEEEETA